MAGVLRERPAMTASALQVEFFNFFDLVLAVDNTSGGHGWKLTTDAVAAILDCSSFSTRHIIDGTAYHGKM